MENKNLIDEDLAVETAEEAVEQETVHKLMDINKDAKEVKGFANYTINNDIVLISDTNSFEGQVSPSFANYRIKTTEKSSALFKISFRSIKTTLLSTSGAG